MIIKKEIKNNITFPNEKIKGNLLMKSCGGELQEKEVFIKSLNGIFILINKEENLVRLWGNIKNILGIDKDLITITLDKFMTFVHQDYKKNFNSIFLENIKESYNDIEIKVIDINKNEKWMALKGKSKYNFKNEIIAFEGYINDITNEKEANLKLEYISCYDDLTGLCNRKYFKKIMDKEFKDNIKGQERGALIIIDLDNFKFINDSYSHKCGDEFLNMLSIELSKHIGPNDKICRFAGDEFIVFISNVSDINDIKSIAKKVMKIFDSPFVINNNKVYSTASVGIAIFPDDGDNFEDLLKNADAAMYRAKSNGRAQYQIFNSNISNEINRIYSIQKGLRTALENEEMFVVFQPKISLFDDEINGFEALLRWNSEKLKSVSPSEFIPIAETTRLIIPIGRFVLKEVFCKVKHLLDLGYDNFKIAINLSEIQLREDDLVSYFQELINEYKIPTRYIEIEITESMLMKSVDKNIDSLLKIKSLGISIALDDFGTGYSSLNHLTRLPIDVLKIDRSFVVDMIKNHKNKYIVENIIQLSHKLGIKVVAEGVEIKEQVDYLKSVFCDTVQGYYYSRPQSFENSILMLNK